MAYAFPGEGSLDYFPCRYGSSRLQFRGPPVDLSGDYIAMLGGTETYGKFVPEPFPVLTGALAGTKVLNLGCANAGPDAFLNDPGVLELARGARAAVVQVMGAQNLSNRLYMVHPRRNDRFVAARPALCALFPEVDFTEFNFIRHMLSALKSVSEDRFELVAEELRSAWLARMRTLLSYLPGDVVLLWLAGQPPVPPRRRADLGADPMLVDAEMVAAIRPLASVWVEVVGRDQVDGGGAMLSGALMPGPETHRVAARALADVLQRLI